MPKVKISDYSTTNSSNTDINSINIDEGCAPSGINNAIREVMVHLKNWQTNASGDGATFASLVVQGTGSFTGAVTMSAGATLSGTNTLSGSTVMAASLGTSASPSIYFSGDTNTGVFSPGADTVAVATGGSERIRVDSSGNVGIGTNASTTKLTISSNTVLPSAGAITNTNLWQVGADAVTNIFLIDGFGANGSIFGRRANGTAASPTAITSQAALLNIAGRGYGSTGYSSGNRIIISFQASEAWTDTAQGTQILFSTTTNGTTTTSERMRIDNAGNVGIGRTPTYLLDVNGTARFNTTVGVGNTAPAASGAGITFPATQSDSSDANTLDDYEEGTWTPVVTGTTGSAGSFAADTSGSYTKVGRLVTCCARIALTNAGSWTGIVRISLPFTVTSSGHNYNGTIAIQNTTFTGAPVFRALSTLAAGDIQLSTSAATLTNVQHPLNNDSFFEFTVSFTV